MSRSPRVITHKPMPNCAMLVVYIRLWALSDMNTAIIYLDFYGKWILKHLSWSKAWEILRKLPCSYWETISEWSANFNVFGKDQMPGVSWSRTRILPLSVTNYQLLSFSVMTSSGTQIQRFKFLADDGLNIFMHRPNCLPCQLVHLEFEFDLKTIFYFSHDELPWVWGHGPGAGEGGARRHLPVPRHLQRTGARRQVTAHYEADIISQNCQL